MNKLKKIIINGYNLFWEEKIVSFINIGTTVLVSLLIWVAVLGFYFFNQLILYIQDRLDFSIYFKENVDQKTIFELQKILNNFPGVKEVEFISRDMALEKFKSEIKANPVISRAIAELQVNPLVDYLIIRADSSEIYTKIMAYIEKSSYQKYIDYINYFENQKVIKKIILFSNQMRILLIFVILALLIFSSLIIFNSLLISIHTQKQYIEILKIIGAGKWYIKLPFFIHILIFVIIGYLISLGVFIIFLIKTENFWPSLISNFYPSTFIGENFIKLNLINFVIILIINYLTAYIALNRYLKY